MLSVRNSKVAFSVLVIVFLSLAMGVSSLFAAPGGTIGGHVANPANCYVDITADIQGEGYYAINLWDDGAFRGGGGAFVPENGSLTVRFFIGGRIAQAVPGIGVYLDDAVGIGYTVTYDSTAGNQFWDDATGDACAAVQVWGAAVTYVTPLPSVPGSTPVENCPYYRPADAALYTIPSGAPAYFAPNAESYAGFDLPAGTWFLYNLTEDFATVWIACQGAPVYVPLANVLR